MSEDKNKIIIERIEKAIEQIDKKESTLYFFISDCKNTPNSNMQYIYQMAKGVQDLGYKVCMLYQINDEYTPKEIEQMKKKGQPFEPCRMFEGVDKWMGEEFGKLRHLNIANGNWKVSPSDFLFIPEVFPSLMRETFEKNIPCKRYVILQNFNYATEFIPLGDQWSSYGITSAIVANTKQDELIKSVFPYMRTKLLPPYFSENLRKPLLAKKLIVNIAAPKSSTIEHIIKTFYWKYPTLQFVTFRHLNDSPIDMYADMLKEGCITIWYDPETPFGYSAIDAIKCGNIVIAKIPEVIPEWATDENGDLKNCCVWYNNIEEIPSLLMQVIGTWMRDAMPQELYDEMDKVAKMYTYTEWKEQLKKVIEEITNSRKQEYIILKGNVANNMSKKDEQ